MRSALSSLRDGIAPETPKACISAATLAAADERTFNGDGFRDPDRVGPHLLHLDLDLLGRDSIVRLALRAIWRVGKEDEVEDVLDELRDLIPDYLRKRGALRQIVAYVAAKRERTDSEEASAARILGAAIQTERI